MYLQSDNIDFLQDMAAEMQDVMFLKVDVDECEDLAGKYNVTSMPTFVFIKKGEKVNNLMTRMHLGLDGCTIDHHDLKTIKTV